MKKLCPECREKLRAWRKKYQKDNADKIRINRHRYYEDKEKKGQARVNRR